MNYRTCFFLMLYLNGLLTTWLIEEWRHPKTCAVKIESGVQSADDWQSIWPELAESHQNTPPALASQAQGAINSEAHQMVREVA